MAQSGRKSPTKDALLYVECDKHAGLQASVEDLWLCPDPPSAGEVSYTMDRCLVAGNTVELAC